MQVHPLLSPICHDILLLQSDSGGCRGLQAGPGLCCGYCYLHMLELMPKASAAHLLCSRTLLAASINPQCKCARLDDMVDVMLQRNACQLA